MQNFSIFIFLFFFYGVNFIIISVISNSADGNSCSITLISRMFWNCCVPPIDCIYKGPTQSKSASVCVFQFPISIQDSRLYCHVHSSYSVDMAMKNLSPRLLQQCNIIYIGHKTNKTNKIVLQTRKNVCLHCSPSVKPNCQTIHTCSNKKKNGLENISNHLNNFCNSLI